MNDPAIVVNRHNQYFAGWRTACAPRYEGDDDHFLIEASWSDRPEDAYQYSCKRAALRAMRGSRSMGLLRLDMSRAVYGPIAVLVYSECEVLREHSQGD